MEWVVTTGKTLDEAKDLALDQLGVDESDAEFEVLEEPKPGLFGRIRGEAKVRARVRPTQARPKVERRKRKGKDEAAAAPAAAEAEAKPARAPRATKSAKAEKVDRADAPAPAAETNDAVAPKRTARKGAVMTEDAERVTDEAGDLPSVQDAATDFLNDLLAAFGLTGQVTVVEVDGDDDLEARIDGSDLGVLIGPGGQTLQAIQELTRLAVQQRRGGARGGWLRVDVSGYRVKRREALERFTGQVVDQVKSSGSAKALEPMTAADRKIVHDTATRLGGVETSSEGEEPRRRVVIRPA